MFTPLDVTTGLPFLRASNARYRMPVEKFVPALDQALARERPTGSGEYGSRPTVIVSRFVSIRRVASHCRSMLDCQVPLDARACRHGLRRIALTIRPTS